jgi:hypothetical protein
MVQYLISSKESGKDLESAVLFHHAGQMKVQLLAHPSEFWFQWCFLQVAVVIQLCDERDEVKSLVPVK